MSQYSLLFEGVPARAPLTRVMLPISSDWRSCSQRDLLLKCIGCCTKSFNVWKFITQPYSTACTCKARVNLLILHVWLSGQP